MIKHLLIFILKTLLVIALILAVCFSLVKLGQWKNRKPTIKPDAQGHIFLEAVDADILGVGTAKYNVLKGVKNIGWWDHTTRSLQWRFTVKTEGPYEVNLNYALPAGLETEFVISVLDQKLNCVIAATGGWDKWRDTSLGQLDLSPDETYKITITPIKTTGGVGVMNLCNLHLKPTALLKQE